MSRRLTKRADRHPGLVLVAAGVAVIAAYANTLGADLVLDAGPLIADNPTMHEPPARALRTILTTPYWYPHANDGLYRPLTTFSYWLNHGGAGGPNPAAFHAVNLVLHLACAGLVYTLVRRLGGRAPAAVLAAAIFGLHPVTTEAVANIVGRADLLATLGLLGGLLCYIEGTQAAPRHRHLWRAGLATAAIGAACSKETGVLLVALMLLYDRVIGPRGVLPRPWRLRTEHTLVILIGVAFVIVRTIVAAYGPLRNEPSPLDNPIVEAGFLAGRLTGLSAVGHQLWILLWPATLSADYSFAQIPVVRVPPQSWNDWRAFVAVAALGGLLLAAWRLRHTRSTAAFFLLFALLTLLPTANLVVIIGSIMAERFLYLPLVGFAAAAAILIDGVMLKATRERATILTAGIVACLLAYGIRTAVRNRDWRDNLTLSIRTAETAPHSAKAQAGYASRLFEADPDRGRLHEVIAAGERAVDIRPDYLPALINLSRYYVAAGEVAARRGQETRPWHEKAIAVLERARTLDADLNRRFAVQMAATGRGAHGIPEIGHIEIYRALSALYTYLKRFDDAADAIIDARRLQPAEPHWYLDLATMLARSGRSEGAVIALWQALALRPEDPDITRQLVERYRSFDADEPLVTPGPDGLALNLAAPTIQRHRCAAYRELVTIFRRARLPSSTAQAEALTTQVCPPG